MKIIPSNLKFIEAANFGEVGCGKVVPFSKGSKTKVAIKPGEMIHPKTYTACGDSLVERGINNGDTLICKTTFALPETFNKVCVVLFNNEYIAKIVIPNYDGTVTLRSANPYYLDKRVDAGAIEIVGIVKKIQRDVQ
jgi:SOS-response transcriptional repressor LexA